MNDLEQRIFDIIKDFHLAGFATMTEDGKPWVRYVSARGREDMTIRFSTFVTSRKVKHIAGNPEVHLTCGCTGLDDFGCYLQIQGVAELEVSPAERHGFWNDNFKAYFSGPDDPSYGVVIVRPYRIELWGDGPKPSVWQA